MTTGLPRAFQLAARETFRYKPLFERRNLNLSIINCVSAVPLGNFLRLAVNLSYHSYKDGLALVTFKNLNCEGISG